MPRIALGIILVVFLTHGAATSDKKIVCYFGGWAVYRPGKGNIEISQIDPTLCTHMIYTFVGLDPNGGIKILDPWADLPDGGGRDGYNKFNQLRQRNPEVKTMVAIGGWNEGSITYSKVVADSRKREVFARNAVEFVQKYGFNGLDFDWEYPNQREGSSEADRKNFVLLLRELRARFDMAGLLLSAAVGAAPHSASRSYIISEMHKYLDFINLMTYDYHGSWDRVTGSNAPLYPGSWEKGDERRNLNINASVRYWLAQGTPADKLVLGVPLYGRSFTLDDPDNFGVGAPASRPGKAGPYTQQEGTLGYNEICEMMLSKQYWNTKFDRDQRIPYAISGNQWISYDDQRSIQDKVAFLNDLDLGGAMVWSLETDDFRGICGEKFPLLKSLNRALRASWIEKPSTPRPSQTNTGRSSTQPQVAGTTAQPSSEETNSRCNPVICHKEGFMRNPDNCAAYYICTPGGPQGYIRHDFQCPSGLMFDSLSNTCNWPYLVDCTLCQ